MTFHRKLYDVHRQMLFRCYNKSSKDYPNYGGRGIYVCDEFMDVKKFTEWALNNGYQEGLTLDRIDTNGNYTPDNCKFSTILQQARNCRRVVMLTVDGVTRPIVEWSEITGISQRTLKGRLKLNWDAWDVINVPPVKGRNQYS